jgi:hypothetical protein
MSTFAFKPVGRDNPMDRIVIGALFVLAAYSTELLAIALMQQ